jgi:hypothetical protein
MFDNKPYKVVDNFLPQKYWERIYSSLCSPYFSWYFQNDITDYCNVNKNVDSLGHLGFNSWVIRNGADIPMVHDWLPSQELILPFCYAVQDLIGVESRINRVRYDMTIYNPNVHLHKPHIDIEDVPHVACVYYVNDSDGNTVLYKQRSTKYDEKLFPKKLDILLEVEPKANRVLIFDGSLIHTGHSPSKNNSRVIVNSNYLI